TQTLPAEDVPLPILPAKSPLESPDDDLGMLPPVDLPEQVLLCPSVPDGHNRSRSVPLSDVWKTPVGRAVKWLCEQQQDGCWTIRGAESRSSRATLTQSAPEVLS